MPGEKAINKPARAQREWEKENPRAEGTVRTNFDRPVKGLYGPADLEGWDYQEKLGFPGAFPFTRGRTEKGYREDLWLVSEYCGFGDAEATNAYLKYLMNEGCTNVHLALDLPTQIGLDSDHPLAAGEVGKIGVAVDSLQDVEILFEGIALDELVNGSPVTQIAAVWLACLLSVLEKQGKPPRSLKANTANDCLMDYYARGTGIVPPEKGLKLSNDVTEYCVRNNLAGVESLSVAGYHAREAGLNGCQEVALMLAQASTYIEDLLERGLNIDDFAHHFNVFICLTEDLLEEVAKIRALRRLWARMMKEWYGARREDSQALKIRALTSGSNLTRQQPLNNIVRVTIEALAGVLGGVQKLYCSAYDEAFAIPTEDSARVALRTQQIIAHETGLRGTIDPLGGSYYLEHLTDEIEEEALAFFKKIQDQGGMLKVIGSGWLAGILTEAAYTQAHQIESGQKTKVGVNKYQIDEQASLTIKEADEEVERRQIAKLERLRRERNNRAVETSLRKLRKAAEDEVNLVPVLMETVRSYATIGEIYSVLREMWGDWRSL